jgi:glycosyltransferase involved in cell wall biosynthesis
MPIHNGARHLHLALDSIVAQGAEWTDGIEVIAVNDGSTDETVPILKRYAEKLPLRIVDAETLGNWVAGTNQAIRLARARYVSMLHHDDLWLPGRLQAIRPVLEQQTPPALIMHACAYVDDAGGRVGGVRLPLKPGVDLEPAAVVARLLVQNFLTIPCVVFSRETALEDGGMDERMWYSGDWDLWLRLASTGRTRYLPERLAAYRVHPASLTFTRGSAEEMRAQMDSVLGKHLARWEGKIHPRRTVLNAARFSVDANATLAALSQGRPAHLGRLALRFVGLGPRGWYRYLHDSRIVERAMAKIRVGFTARRINR